MNLIEFIGHCSSNLLKTFILIAQGKIHWRNYFTQAVVIGVDSTIISAIITAVAASVIALQISKQFELTGAEAYIGSLISIAIIREIAPVFAALAVAARAGTAIASEIANMQITEQVDAIKVLKIDPIEYLFLPRILAGATIIPLVTIICQFCAVISGMFIAKLTINLHYARYLESVWLYTKADDIYKSVIKAVVFGTILTVICATQGYLTKGGAREVGIAVTQSAIWSSIAIILFDYLLTWMFYSS